jgi:hypothetical protein
MSIHVRDIDEKPGACGGHRPWRCQLKVIDHSMQPNNKVADTNLAMNGLAIGSAVDTARGETQSIHEKVMLRGDVLAYEDRDESFAFVHSVLVRCALSPERQN